MSLLYSYIVSHDFLSSHLKIITSSALPILFKKSIIFLVIYFAYVYFPWLENKIREDRDFVCLFTAVF